MEDQEEIQQPQYYADFDNDGNITGFYELTFHGDSIPEKAIPITEEEWQTYLSNQGKYKVDNDTVREKTQEELDEEAAARPPAPPDPLDVLGAELTQAKLREIQQQQVINSLGAELTAVKLDLINLKGGA